MDRDSKYKNKLPVALLPCPYFKINPKLLNKMNACEKGLERYSQLFGNKSMCVKKLFLKIKKLDITKEDTHIIVWLIQNFNYTGKAKFITRNAIHYMRFKDGKLNGCSLTTKNNQKIYSVYENDKIIKSLVIENQEKWLYLYKDSKAILAKDCVSDKIYCLKNYFSRLFLLENLIQDTQSSLHSYQMPFTMSEHTKLRSKDEVAQ